MSIIGRIKPPIWNLSAGLVDPKWNFVHRSDAVFPLWENTGTAFDLKHRYDTAATSVSRVPTPVGLGAGIGASSSLVDADAGQMNGLSSGNTLTVTWYGRMTQVSPAATTYRSIFQLHSGTAGQAGVIGIFTYGTNQVYVTIPWVVNIFFPTLTLNQDKDELWTVRRNGSDWKMWRDGVEIATATVATAFNAANAHKLILGYVNYGGTWSALPSVYQYVIVSREPWTIEQHRMLASDPYGWMRPREGYPGWLATTGGGASLSGASLLGAAGQSAIVRVTHQASAAQVLGPAAQAAIAAIAGEATAAQDLGPTAQAAAAQVTVAGMAGQTVAALQQAAAAQLTEKAAAAQALGPVVLDAAARVTEKAVAAQALGPAAQDATTENVIAGVAAQALGPVSEAATAQVTERAAASQQLGPAAQTAAAQVTHKATLAQLLGATAESGAILVTHRAAAAQTLGTAAQAAIAVLTVEGVIVQVLPAVVQEAGDIDYSTYPATYCFDVPPRFAWCVPARVTFEVPPRFAFDVPKPRRDC